MTTLQAVLTVAICAIGTFLTRSLAFFAFPDHKPTPKYIVYLGKVLPFAITAMLIVYCLKEVTPGVYPFGLPELIGVAVVSVSYLAIKNSLLSIGLGTIVYMVLVQVVF